MTQILVVPHGGRWAVKESRDATPVAEYETCELAEVAAQQLAAERGGEVVVSREADDFEGPDNVHTEDPESEQGEDPIETRMSDVRGSEEPRTPQAGL